MAVKIHKFLLDDLSFSETVDADLDKATGAVIFGYPSPSSSSATLSFTIDVVREHAPEIGDIEFCTAIRKEIELTSTGPKNKEQTIAAQDIGDFNHIDESPKRPVDLPPDFEQLHEID